MSAIKSVPGSPDPVQTNPTTPENSPSSDPATVKTVSEVSSSAQQENAEDTTENSVSSASFASYEEAVAVADKLQKRINEIADVPQKVSIRIDDNVDQYIIEIKDAKGNVVKQFPPEKVLNLHKRLDDLSGMVIDEMI